MRDIEITKREILSSVIIILVMVSIGYFISTAIHNSVSVDSERYFKAMKIDNDEELFGYAIDTEVGDILSYGTLIANEPVSDPMIDGEYFSIIKIEEHYVMKTRIVTYTDANGKTQTRTETYWEWDEVDREYFNTDTFHYLGRDFDVSKIKLNNYKHHETVSKGFISNVRWDEVDREYFNTDTFHYLGRDFDVSKIKLNNYKHHETVSKGFISNVRWVFRVIPTKFNATIYSKTRDGSITENELYNEQTITSVIERKEQGADSAVIFFWVAWSVLIAVVVVFFVALDNRYLNNK